MNIKSAPLYAAVVGGLVKGFHVVAIDVKSEIDRLFYKNESRRVHTQCIELTKPEDRMDEFQEDRGGDHVVFVGGVSGGEMFGPFSSSLRAAEFGARVCDAMDDAQVRSTVLTVVKG